MSMIIVGAITGAFVGFILACIVWSIFCGIDGLLDRLFPKKIIHGPDGSPYMHRWFALRTRMFAIFIHKFVRSDYDRALHDHPWNFLVIPIWRGYIEHSATISDFLSKSERDQLGERAFLDKTSRRVYPIIGTRFRSAEFVHRVELLKRDRGEHYSHITGNPQEEFLPSWSIFIRFRKRRHWGFWCPKGWRPWIEGKSDHCDDAETPSPEIKRHTGAEDVV